MAYSDKVVDHFNNPRNMGSFKKDEEGVGTGMVGAPECGDVMKLQIMEPTTSDTQTPVITLTDAAIKEVKRLINVQGIEEGGLRLGVKGGGCSGLSYTINFDEKIGPYDQVYDFDGVKIIVDAKSAIYLQGTQLDYHKDLMGGNFKFVNPNANKTCGCGESFSA